MKGRTWLSIAAVVLAAACAGSGAPAPPGGLAYRVPSPPMAKYLVVDSAVVENRPFLQRRQTTTTIATTLGLTFERVAGGVGVTGIAEHFEVSLKGGVVVSPGALPGLDDLTGNLDFVINPRGDVTVTSLPELPSEDAAFSRFASIAQELFPRLPDRAVDAGDTWMDTVTWSSGSMRTETTFTKAYTYTLVGDTVVDGRPLLHIAVAGEAAFETEGQVGPSALSSSSAGQATGLILWDPRRGLPVYAQYEQALEGTSTRAGMPPSSTRHAIFRRVWLVE